MTIKEIVFSPTGGTRAVAGMLSRALDADAFRIDLTSPYAAHEEVALSADDVAVIAMPCYYGRVPVLAAKRLAEVAGHGARAVIVAVYGNRAYDDELIELKDLAEASGFRVVAAVAAVAEHSIVRQYAEGRPDAEDDAVLRGFAAQIADKLVRGDDHAPEVPGQRPYKALPDGGNVPQADSACIHCGKCADFCPASAIDPAHLETADPARCISCMCCVSVCPVQARDIAADKRAGITAHLKDVCSVRKSPELYL